MQTTEPQKHTADDKSPQSETVFMNKSSMFSVCISFSGLVFKFIFPNHFPLPEEITALQCDDCDCPDEEFEIRLLTKPLQPENPEFFSNANMKVYKTEVGRLRIYTSLTEADGCQVAFLLRSDGKNVLYYPASKWDYYSAHLRCFHLIAGEVLLLRHNAMLLHSSVVMYNGKAVLFSGPSGAGKSTQAALWNEHLGADILNGDRCVIMQRDGIFYGGGSPWCGTSGIRKKEQAPIAGIFLVNQAEKNSVQQLGSESFRPLFTQITVNSWDEEFMKKITQMTAELIEQAPIYRLNCLPDAQAAELACKTLFKKENLL